MRTRSSAGGLTLILPPRWGTGELREREPRRGQINNRRPTVRLELEARSGTKLMTELAWKITPAVFMFPRTRQRKPESEQKTKKKQPAEMEER